MEVKSPMLTSLLMWAMRMSHPGNRCQLMGSTVTALEALDPMLETGVRLQTCPHHPDPHLRPNRRRVLQVGRASLALQVGAGANQQPPTDSLRSMESTLHHPREHQELQVGHHHRHLAGIHLDFP